MFNVMEIFVMDYMFVSPPDSCIEAPVSWYLQTEPQGDD